jgi:gas vesicle protein
METELFTALSNFLKTNGPPSAVGMAVIGVMSYRKKIIALLGGKVEESGRHLRRREDEMVRFILQNQESIGSKNAMAINNLSEALREQTRAFTDTMQEQTRMMTQAIRDVHSRIDSLKQ